MKHAFYDENVFLKNDSAKDIYRHIRSLPVVDYHCHLSPKEIYEDKPFDNIGQMWLGGDHYKWRLMRACGIDEAYITGSKSDKEKFCKYAEALETAIGNPLYHWSHMELKQFFDIHEPLTSEHALDIWNRANKVIADEQLSPRKCIVSSNVEYIATTDDIIDSLEYHKKIAADDSFHVKVAPSFRTDNLFLYKADNYKDYIAELSETSGIEVKDLASLKAALSVRIDYFCAMGCKMTDVGIERFPQCIGTDAQADEVFQKTLRGEEVSTEEYDCFISNMYFFLGSAYKKHDLIMQLHLAVKRNASTKMFASLGKDVGGDCVGAAICADHLVALLDCMEKADALPTAIVYTLNPTIYYEIATAIRSFRNVSLGAAWWFCDHLDGIQEQMRIYSHTASLNSFFGMLTDSRSFLSYARHDYFRRILAQMLGEIVENGEFAPIENVYKIAENVSYYNIKNQLKL